MNARRRLAASALALLFALSCVPTDRHEHGLDTEPGPLWVMGYWAGWQRALYPNEVVDFDAVTHLVLTIVRPEVDGRLTNAVSAPDGRSVYGDTAPDAAASMRDLAARAHAAGRRLLFMLGGAGMGARFRSACSAANVDVFVTSILAEIDALPADGVDLAWDGLGDEPGDVPRLLELVTRLKEARPELALTLGLPWSAPAGVAALVPHVDRFNLKTFALFGTWSGWVSWHFGALHPGDYPNLPSVEGLIDEAVGVGLPRDKLGFAIGFFGIVFQGPDPPYPEVTGPGMEVVDGDGNPLPGLTYDSSDGIFTYANLKRYYLDPNPSAYVWYDDVQMGGLSFPSPGFTPADFVPDGDPAWAPGGADEWRKRATWISFEDPRSIAQKGAWARAQGLGSCLLWTLNEGCVDPATGDNPPLAAVKQAFLP
jgi:chitinase